jgi:hypothetical protein
MDDPTLLVALGGAGVAGIAITAAATLKGWSDWLQLKRTEMEGGARDGPALPSPAARIELADLKERVRKLEAIANGIDLPPRRR